VVGTRILLAWRESPRASWSPRTSRPARARTWARAEHPGGHRRSPRPDWLRRARIRPVRRTGGPGCCRLTPTAAPVPGARPRRAASGRSPCRSGRAAHTVRTPQGPPRRPGRVQRRSSRPGNRSCPRRPGFRMAGSSSATARRAQRRPSRPGGPPARSLRTPRASQPLAAPIPRRRRPRSYPAQ
jgi:hypothetical protein